MIVSAGKYLLIGLFFFVPIVPGISFIHNGGAIDYCGIYGSVYIEPNDPKKADYRVFVEEYEAPADLWVYKADDRLFADKEGLWYITNQKAFADYVIYIDKDKYLADFSVYYIDVESFAGCND